MNKDPIKCDKCGKFLSYSDIDKGIAILKMVTPDSSVSYETWERICSTCNLKGKTEEDAKALVTRRRDKVLAEKGS